jgi:hypothetical protein
MDGPPENVGDSWEPWRDRLGLPIEPEQEPEPEPEPKCDSPLVGSDVAGMKFPRPVLASKVKATSGSRAWLCQGLLTPGGITLLSALWKSGKTTFITAPLKTMASGGKFCGLDVRTANVLYVTEEDDTIWQERIERFGLQDNIQFVFRPFLIRPDFTQWLDFLEYIIELHRETPFDLVVFDTLSNLWPVENENDAGQVQAAMMPLRMLSRENIAVELVHHLRKSDGNEATGSRGSGALTAFVDIILELRRHNPVDNDDRNRVITGYSRYSPQPAEMVVCLDKDDATYTSLGDRSQVGQQARQNAIVQLLPTEEPGLTLEEIREKWPTEPIPSPRTLGNELPRGLSSGCWRRTGGGKRGDPYRYWAKAD